MGNSKSSQNKSPQLNSINSHHQSYLKSQKKPKTIDTEDRGYSQLNKIKNPHQQKNYKRHTQPKQCEERHDFYGPDLIPVVLDSDEYKDKLFTDEDYINKIPKKKKGTFLKIDDSKTMFFRIGRCATYSDTIFTFTGFSENGHSQWTDIENLTESENIKINFPRDILELLNNRPIRHYIMQAGWFVLVKQVWGFLLNLESITEAYQGRLHYRWTVLLEYQAIRNMFEKFGDYIQEMNAESAKSKNDNMPREIPTTDFDPVLSKGFVPFYDQLFLHQQQEVSWMFNLENYPAIKMKRKQNALPFLDTGFYIDLNDLSKFITFDSEDEFVELFVPGGILASQIGSGKTVTAIALATIGSQLKKSENIDPEIRDIYEEVKVNDVIDFNGTEAARKELNHILDGVYEPSFIIVTKNILFQWAEEFQKFAPGLKVAVIENFEDFRKLNIIQKENAYIIENYDIILTHRKVMEDNASIDKICPGIFKVTFRRVMMDEFHELTNYMIQQLKEKKKESQKEVDMLKFYQTLMRIDRRFTWGITGTPDSLNYYNEAIPLFKLLNLGDQYNMANAYAKLKEEFITTCMRKNPRSVDLPALNKSIQKVQFSQLQNLLYKGKLNYASNQKLAQEICSHLLPQWRKMELEKDHLGFAIETIKKKQQDEITEIHEKIKNHNDAKLESRLEILKSEDSFFNQVIKLLSEEKFECPVCLVECGVNQLVITECLHGLCEGCYESLKKAFDVPQCAVCREFIQNSSLIVHPKFANAKENKLTAIIKAIQETNKNDKIIIFTQFHNLVNHLMEIFEEFEIPYIVLIGEPSEINMRLAKFKHNPEFKVLLMSIEQAASGINVPEANHVFFAHPIFGMEFEKAALRYNQCIGRVYRIGQKKKVDVKLFVTTDSLEEDMVPSFSKYSCALI